MSKTSQCIELLRILYSRKQPVNIAELAGELETNPRNIPEYVKELRLIGFDIEPVHGRYGGYILNRESTFPSVRLNDAERLASCHVVELLGFSVVVEFDVLSGCGW